MKKFYDLPDWLFEKMHHDKETGCWEWLGAKDANNQPKCRDRNKQRTNSAPRVVYEYVTKTTIPKGLSCVRECENKLCCNPDHLILGKCKNIIRDNCQECGGDLTISYYNGYRMAYCKPCRDKKRMARKR